MSGRPGILKVRGCSNDGSICRLCMAHCSLGNSAGRLRRGVLVVRTGPLDPPSPAGPGLGGGSESSPLKRCGALRASRGVCSSRAARVLGASRGAIYPIVRVAVVAVRDHSSAIERLERVHGLERHHDAGSIAERLDGADEFRAGINRRSIQQLHGQFEPAVNSAEAAAIGRRSAPDTICCADFSNQV
jgi:hypothetical protein